MKSFLKLSLVTLTLAALTLTSTGCGSKVSGVYVPSGTALFSKMDFKSDGKVEITGMGQTQECTYVVDGDSVKITNAGQTQVFKIDDKGCLDGGELLGKYCHSN